MREQMTTFKDRLKELRTAKNMTQKELASQIGVKNTIVSFYENGDRFPSTDVIISLASIFHVSSDYLLGIDREESITISELSESDKSLVRNIVDSLKEKNNKE